MGPVTTQPYQPPQHGLRAGTALTRGGGGGTHHPVSSCPPAPLPPHGRGGAQPVQSQQLPSEPTACGQVVLSLAAPGWDLAPELKPLDAVPALPVLRGRPWVQGVHPARSDPGEGGGRRAGGVTWEGRALSGGRSRHGPRPN